jgi:hypothetical protein
MVRYYTSSNPLDKASYNPNTEEKLINPTTNTYFTVDQLLEEEKLY